MAQLRPLRRIFLLERDGMTRISMRMLIAGFFWGAVGGFDAFGYPSQVVAYAHGSELHLSTQEIYSSLTLHRIRELFGFAQQIELAVPGLLVIHALGLVPRREWTLEAVVGLVDGGSSSRARSTSRP